MSKLIIEMEMDGIPSCCGLCDPLFTVVCATKHDQTIDKMMLRVGRPSWCPICGVLPEEHGDLIDRDKLKRAFCNHCDGDEPCTDSCVDIGLIETAPTVIAVERKDDGTTAD